MSDQDATPTVTTDDLRSETFTDAESMAQSWFATDNPSISQLLELIAENNRLYPGGTEFFTVDREVDPSGFQMVISLRDSHRPGGMMTWTLYSNMDGHWRKDRQDMYTAHPGDDELALADETPTQDSSLVLDGPDFVAIYTPPRSEFPVNPPDRPGRHLTQLLEGFARSLTSDHPTTALYGYRAGQVEPNDRAFAMAKTLMDTLAREVARLRRTPSWRGWPIASSVAGAREDADIDNDSAPTANGHHQANSDQV